jgi:glyoxylase-like metal-dependent hydrolase (beta-lactamase superfamily II)/rhodanese-related sulfurtransferase
MKVEQIYTGCLAQGAYYIESAGEAVIIDPLRETTPYLNKLQKNGARLKYIFETHFHADFVSGHLDLAKKTGATIVYGPNAQTEFEKYEARDGEELKVGQVTFRVLHTPGHTPESTTYLLLDENGREHALFTGDTLFIGDVGRPDLAQKGDLTSEDLAGWLYDSLRTKIMPLPDDVIVYPAHGAGSACGKNMSKETWDTLGNQKRVNYALRADLTREAFIREVATGLLPPPQYFAKNAALNKTGYDSIDNVLRRGAVPLSPQEFEQIVESEDALVLDTRKEQDFKNGFIPGSVFIGIDGSFAPWVGALIVDLRQPIVLVCDENRAEEVVTRLARVGYDNTLGYLAGGIAAWKAAGKPIETIESITPAALAERVQTGTADHILDVRKPTEYRSQHLTAAENFPLDFINQNMDQLDRRETYHVHCAGGYRSMITASILKARGFDQVVDVSGGWKALEQTNLPKTAYVAPEDLPQELIDEVVNVRT